MTEMTEAEREAAEAAMNERLDQSGFKIVSRTDGPVAQMMAAQFGMELEEYAYITEQTNRAGWSDFQETFRRAQAEYRQIKAARVKKERFTKFVVTVIFFALAVVSYSIFS